MVDDVRGRRIAAGTAEPFGAAKAFHYTARVVDSAVTGRPL